MLQIITDSSSEITEQEAKELGIQIVPLTVIFGEETVTMTAYEVSVSKLAAFDDSDSFDLEGEFDLYAMPSDNAG